jgi:hypothetical protein
VNLTVICHFLLSACDLIHIFVGKKSFSNYAENIGCHLAEFSCPGFVHPFVKSLSM